PSRKEARWNNDLSAVRTPTGGWSSRRGTRTRDSANKFRITQTCIQAGSPISSTTLQCRCSAPREPPCLTNASSFGGVEWPTWQSSPTRTRLLSAPPSSGVPGEEHDEVPVAAAGCRVCGDCHRRASRRGPAPSLPFRASRGPALAPPRRPLAAHRQRVHLEQAEALQGREAPLPGGVRHPAAAREEPGPLLRLPLARLRLPRRRRLRRHPLLLLRPRISGCAHRRRTGATELGVSDRPLQLQAVLQGPLHPLQH